MFIFSGYGLLLLTETSHLAQSAFTAVFYSSHFVLNMSLSCFSETQVSCVFNESCVLPCSFQSGPDPDIFWLKTPGEVPVHIYYKGQDQVSHQNQDFKDRTSLFVDQISRGNGSLLLREVKLQDEGTYKCFTNTADRDNKTSFIDLTVRGKKNKN